jgi:hypothetical protein
VGALCPCAGAHVGSAKDRLEEGKAEQAVVVEQAEDAARVAFVCVGAASHATAVGGQRFAAEAFAADGDRWNRATIHDATNGKFHVAGDGSEPGEDDAGGLAEARSDVDQLGGALGSSEEPPGFRALVAFAAGEPALVFERVGRDLCSLSRKSSGNPCRRLLPESCR